MQSAPQLYHPDRESAVWLYLRPKSGRRDLTQTLKVDPNEPDAALKGNQAATEIATGRDVHQEILTITTKPRQEEFDRQAIDRAEDEGMIVHPGQSNAPLREQEVAS